MRMRESLSAAEAAQRLGVSRQTLYAYVSRGLLHAQPGPDSRASRYLAEEVEQLAGQRRRGRKPREVAKATLNWGLPVLESAITLIADGNLYYRGRSVPALARTETVETVAALLWQCPRGDAFGPRAPEVPAVFAGLQSDYAGRRCEEILLPLFSAAADDYATAPWQRTPARLAAGCGALVRVLAACLLGTAPSAEPLHLQCARVWRLGAAGADLIRRVLILCADHELNASSFTARCVASTGASLRAALIAGLAALSGGRHGGITARVEALWDEIGAQTGGNFNAGVGAAVHAAATATARPAPDPADHADVSPQAAFVVEAALRQRLARGEDLPGFGHYLYPQGDVRAAEMLACIPDAALPWRALAEACTDLVGQGPTLDFGLVAVRRYLQLPAGAAFGLFALGRSLGWIAHALEQRASDTLIRPRAAYVGPRPGEV